MSIKERSICASWSPSETHRRGHGRKHPKILESIDTRTSKQADIVLFSELALCGYPPEDLLLHPCFHRCAGEVFRKDRSSFSRALGRRGHCPAQYSQGGKADFQQRSDHPRWASSSALKISSFCRPMMSLMRGVISSRGADAGLGV